MASKAYEIKQYLLAHPTIGNAAVAKLFKTTRGYVVKLKVELNKGKLSIPLEHNSGPAPIPIDQVMVERQRQAIISDLKQRNAELHRFLDELNAKYDEALALKVDTPVRVPKITAKSDRSGQAVAIVQYSDWHVEERIEKSLVGGLNEYNPEIAKARAGRLIENTIKLIRKERQDVKISELVVWLGGDFINNYIHEAYVQTNFLTPIEAVTFAKELLKRSLLTLAEHAGVAKIILLCSRGNHGRLTKRMESTVDYKMNFEAMLYHILKQELDQEPFEWHVPDSELGYAEVYTKTIRYFHGHQVSYQGGVGDLTVPLNKVIQKWDRTRKADWNLMGHYHRYWMPTQNCSLNGSLCGFNPYALSLGFSYEPPTQVFQLLDAKRGFTVRTPILCD
jgi:hypothetical protein